MLCPFFKVFKDLSAWEDQNRGSSFWQPDQEKHNKRMSVTLSKIWLLFSFSVYSWLWLCMMRDQKWISAGWLQLQRCHCARPSQQERLFGAAGQCCLCVKKWSKSRCDKFGNAPLRQWRHHRHPPQLDLFAVCHNQKNAKIFKITDINFPVSKRNTSAGSYRASPRRQRRDSYPVTLECNDDPALWLALTVFFSTVAKWPNDFRLSSFRSSGT